MSSEFKTAQEAFWAGEFGDEYADRNQGKGWVAANTSFFSRILGRTTGVQSVLELGSNIGLNLMAIESLLPDVDLTAVEINQQAVSKLRERFPKASIHEASLLEFEPTKTVDFAFIKGVLIHINPDALAQAYDCLYQSSHRYMLIAEYYNPSPVEIDYRGHQGRLFKRDFAGEFLDRFQDVNLLDYGFVYRRDPNFPQDDITWFLMEK